MQLTSVHYVPDMQLPMLIRDVNEFHEFFSHLEKLISGILRIPEPQLLKRAFLFAQLDRLGCLTEVRLHQ